MFTGISEHDAALPYRHFSVHHNPFGTRHDKFLLTVKYSFDEFNELRSALDDEVGRDGILSGRW
jgi:hypothetical protein